MRIEIKRIGRRGLWLASFCIVFATMNPARALQSRASERIDGLVLSALNDRGITRSKMCSDAVFLRRVYLDMTGTLPTPQEAEAFLSNSRMSKRSRLIEALFEREEFADYWAMKWCDLLRVKAEFPSNLWPNAVQAYHRWIRTAIYTQQPYDEFARALLTSSGSNFRAAPVNFYRAVPKREGLEIAQVVALTFMGMRTDGWERDQVLGMAAFFGKIGYKKTAEWKEEIVYFDPAKVFLDPATERPVAPRFPNGQRVVIPDGKDPRIVFTDWLVANDAFSKSIVNRIWYWLLGRGIVHEPDDFRAGNPPQNPDLLDFLAQELVASGYDLRHIYRIILNSKTYQLASIHTESNFSDEANFSRYSVRRMDAEVLIDAICQITGTTEEYSSSIPEPFTWIPKNQRSITLADGSITSPFLDLFGRPPRDSGYESERNNRPSSAQKLHLLNSTHIQQKIRNSTQLLGLYAKNEGKNKKIQWAWKSPVESIDHMYLTVLSRYPTHEEKSVMLDYIKNGKLNRKEASMDLVWALLNSKEFIYKH